MPIEIENITVDTEENIKAPVDVPQEDQDGELQQNDEAQAPEYERNIYHTPDITVPSTSKATIPFELNSMYYQPQFQTDDKPIEQMLIETNTQSTESPFKKYLFFPKEELKNQKRIKERSRSVITSDYWLSEQQKKEELKLQKEELKLTRKRTREEKQKEKILKKSRKKCRAVKNKQKKIKHNNVEENKLDWKCYKCKVFWRDQHFLERKAKWFSCISCSNKIHRICVPTKHINTLGLGISDSEDESEFVCEDCGITLDSSDSDISESWDNVEEDL